MSNMAIPKGNGVEDFCAKCKGFKKWNLWYNPTPDLCDDCSGNGKYSLLTDEDAREIELINNMNEGYVEYLKEHIFITMNSLEYYSMGSKQYSFLMESLHESLCELSLIENRMKKTKLDKFFGIKVKGD